MNPPSSTPLDAMRRLAQAVLSLLHTRLELVGIELAEEKGRLVAVLFMGLAAMLLLTLALITLTVLIAVLCWDNYRWQALALLTVLYGGTAVFLAFRARGALRSAPAMFESTLEEFRKDRHLF